MARRAAPGRRDRLEAVLAGAVLPDPTLRGALEFMRELLDLHDWQETPLAPPFQTAAAVLRAGELVAGGVAPTAALDIAAVELDLNPETLRSRVARWSGESRARVCDAHAGNGSTTASLVSDAAPEQPEPKRAA
jgi:hypothetical protein